MGILDSGVEAISLTKAIIEVVDTTKIQTSNKNVANAVGRINDYKASNVKFNAAKTQLALKKEASKLKQMASAVTGIGLGDSEELQAFNDKIKALQPGAEIKRFEVQFNPSTLSLSGSGGGMSQFTNFSAGNKTERGVSYEKASEHIEMSVQLVFDETSNLVAFPGDIAGINVSNLANTGINMGLNKLKGRPSVQTEVEGFLAVIRNENTRSVAFCWGRMLYFGYVNRISTKYTLFNPSGKPVRATVDLNIVCADKDVSAENLGFWQEKYENFFKTDMSLGGARNGLVNLTNFSR